MGAKSGGIIGAIVYGILAVVTGGWALVPVLFAAAVGFGIGAGAGALMSAVLPEVGNLNFGLGSSPSYDSIGARQNTLSNKLPIPVVLGRYKIYGNIVWQSEPGESVKQIIVLCQGPVNSITEIKLNEEAYTEFPDVTVEAYLGEATQNADSRVGSLEGLNLRYYAYLAVTLVASDKLSGDVKVSCVVEGEKPQVFDSASGTWSGEEFTENPAALIRHVLKNKRWGLGKTDLEVDDETFGAGYDYCNEPVDDGDDGLEPRFRLNYYIDAHQPAIDIIDKLLACCRGAFVFEGNKIRLHINKASPVVFRFGDGSSFDTNRYDNMEKDSFRWELETIDEVPNELILHWIDPDQEYIEATVVRVNRIDQEERGKVKTKDISLVGIQYQGQALREAKYIEAAYKHNAVRATWVGFLDSRDIRIGQVVSVTAKGAVYQNKEFRVVKKDILEGGRIQYSGVEYNASIYDDRLGSVISSYPQPSGPNIFAPLSDVTNLTAEEFGYQQGRTGGNGDGSHIANIDLSWTAIPNDELLRLQYYRIDYSDDGGSTYKDAGFANKDSSSYRITDLRVGVTYIARVRTVSNSGVNSTGVTGAVTIEGKDNLPSQVANFDVAQESSILRFTWDVITDVDADLYEIRKGGDWSSATEIGQTRSNELIIPVGETGTVTFLIKSIDTAGNYSEIPTSDVITIVPPPDRNFVLELDMFSKNRIHNSQLSNMQLVSSTLYDNTYSRKAIALITDPTWEVTEAEGKTWEQQEFEGGLDMDQNFETSGTTRMLFTDKFDLETIFEFEVVPDVDYNDAENGTVTTKINISEDGVTWGGWEDLDTTAQYRARYVIFGFDVTSSDSTKPVTIYAATMFINVPTSLVDWGADVAVPLVGKTVSFGQNFTVPPRLIITITNGVLGIVQVNTKTADEFNVQCFDKDGSGIDTAEIDWEARGW